MWRVSFTFNHFKGNYFLPFRMKIQTVQDKHPQTKSTHWEPSRPISHNAVGFALQFSAMCSHARFCAQDTTGTPAPQTVNASVLAAALRPLLWLVSIFKQMYKYLTTITLPHIYSFSSWVRPVLPHGSPLEVALPCIGTSQPVECARKGEWGFRKEKQETEGQS